MKGENRIWELMARKLSGEASEEEIKELQELLQKNPDIAYTMGVLDGLWKTPVKEPGEATEKAAARQLLARAKQQSTESIQPTKEEKEQGQYLKKIHRRQRTFYSTGGSGKISSYFKTGVRNLLRNKGFSF